MAYELAKAYVQIIPTTKGIKGELGSILGNEADAAGKSAGGKFSSAFGGVMKTVGAATAASMAAVATGVIGGTKALIEGAKATAEYGDNVDKMSQKMGLSAEKYQEWDFVMQHCGTSIESMKAPMKTLATAAENGSEAFDRLGLSQEQISSMSQEELFGATISALQDVEDSTERTYLAGQLLGRGATELGALLNMSADETAKMAEQAHALGGVMTDTAVKDAARFQDSMQNAQFAVSGLKNSLMSELLPGFSDVLDGFTELVAGTGEGEQKIQSGVQSIMNNLSGKLPDVLKIVGSVLNGVLAALPGCAEQIVAMLPELFNSFIDAITNLIPGIVGVLPNLISAALDLITQLIGHLSEFISPIIKAIPTIIKSFVKGLLDNLPELLSGVLELVTSIAEELPNICVEIIEYIPELFVQLASAIIKCIPQILLATGKLVTGIVKSLLGIKDPVDEINEKLGTIGEAAKNSWDEISQALNQEVDVSGLLSSLGKTTSDINSEISRLEGEITNILSTRMAEQEGLRQEDIENIKNYMEQIRKLEEEKLSIYETQADAQIEIMKNATDASAEERMKQFGQLQSYNEQELAEAESYHNSQYVEAKNYYAAMMTELDDYLKTGGSTEDEYYISRQAAIQSEYDEMIRKADTFYNAKNSQIKNREAEGLALIAGSNNAYVTNLNTTFGEAAKANDAWVAAMKSSSSNYVYEIYQAQQGQKDAITAMLGSLDEAGIKNATAWLNLAAETKSKGGELSGDVKATAENIIGAFDNMPTEMRSAGKDALEGLTVGMKDYIPELEDTSDMTAQEIVDTIKEFLDINSPSVVMMNIGENTVAGLVQGMTTAAPQAGSIMQQIGVSLIQGIGYGMQSQSGWLNEIAASAVTNAVNAAKRAGKIESPSKVMRKEVGQMLSAGLALGITDEEDRVVGAIDEIGNSIWNASKNMEMGYGLAGDLSARLSMNEKAIAGAVYFGGRTGTSGNEGIAPVIYITNNIDGAENPEEFASRLVRQIKMEMRMA